MQGYNNIVWLVQELGLKCAPHFAFPGTLLLAPGVYTSILHLSFIAVNRRYIHIGAIVWYTFDSNWPMHCLIIFDLLRFFAFFTAII